MPKQVSLDGPQVATAYILDAAPLCALSAGEVFESIVVEVTKDVRARVEADAAFVEKKPLYGLAYQGALYGVSAIAEAGVRELLEEGVDVSVRSERTGDALAGFSGVKLYLPERDAFDTWTVLERAGVDVDFDAFVEVINLNTDDVTLFENGRVAVSIAPGEGTDIALTVTQGEKSHTWQIYSREHHSYEVLEELGMRAYDDCVIVHHDSFTQHGARYFKLYIVVDK